MSDTECLICKLSYASFNGNLRIVKQLINEGVSPASTSPCNTALFDAINNTHDSVVKLLLDNGADPNQNQTDYDDSPLSLAIEKLNAEIALMLYNAGAKIDSYSIFQMVNGNDEPKRLEIALSVGMDIDFVDNKTGRTCLHESAMYGYERTTEYLLKQGASAKNKDNWGQLALDLARTNSHYSVMELFKRV